MSCESENKHNVKNEDEYLLFLTSRLSLENNRNDDDYQTIKHLLFCIECCQLWELHERTLFLTFAIYRKLKQKYRIQNGQLIGVCLLIASKFEDVVPIRIETIRDSFRLKIHTIREIELKILGDIGFRLVIPTTWIWLEYFTENHIMNKKHRYYAFLSLLKNEKPELIAEQIYTERYEIKPEFNEKSDVVRELEKMLVSSTKKKQKK